MKRADFDSMPIDQLWALHEKIATTLATKLASEKIMLEDRLRQLTQRSPIEYQARAKSTPNSAAARRPYPSVVPKYRNPDEPSQTWSGRGKQPRWLVAQLIRGKPISDFRIDTEQNEADEPRSREAERR